MTQEHQPLVPKDYESMMLAKQDRLTQLLAGSDVEPERFIGMVTQAIARQPRLLNPDVDKESVLLAVLSVAEMGLVPSGPFGGAWLVPYRDKKSGKQKVQPIVDWRGFIKMAMRSGQLRGAWAHPAYEGDSFRYVLGDDPALMHHPTLNPDERGNVTHFYAVAHLNSGERVFEVMTRGEVDAIRKRARASDEGPWVTDYIEMGRKTVVRKLFKYLPVAQTPQMAKALEEEDDWNGEPGALVAAAPMSDRRARLVSHMQGAETDAVSTEPSVEAPPSAEPANDSDPAVGTGESSEPGEATKL